MSDTDYSKATLRLRLVEQPGMMVARIYGPKHGDGGDYAPLLETGNKEFAHLMVEAVNSYDRLKRIEAKARELAAHVTAASRPHLTDLQIGNIVRLSLITKARELLAEIEKDV